MNPYRIVAELDDVRTWAEESCLVPRACLAPALAKLRLTYVRAFGVLPDPIDEAIDMARAQGFMPIRPGDTRGSPAWIEAGTRWGRFFQALGI